jgi:hypothetical protein
MKGLESLSSIPTAIDAILECISRATSGRGTKDPKVMQELGRVTDEVATLRDAMIQFSLVPVDIAPWKHAHHCTNQVLHSEMTVLFKMSRPSIAKLVSNDPDKIESELQKVNNPRSSRNHILAQESQALELQLPPYLHGLLNRDPTKKHSWHSYILSSVTTLQEHFDNRQEELFCKVLDDYREFVLGLNQAADNRLLSGLGKLGDRLDEMRGRLTSKTP